MTELVSTVSSRIFSVGLILTNFEGLMDRHEARDRLTLALEEPDNLVLDLQEAEFYVSEERKPPSDLHPEEE